MLSPIFGEISSLPLKNSGELLNKINDINKENKYHTSLKIKFLNTHIAHNKRL